MHTKIWVSQVMVHMLNSQSTTAADCPIKNKQTAKIKLRQQVDIIFK